MILSAILSTAGRIQECIDKFHANDSTVVFSYSCVYTLVLKKYHTVCMLSYLHTAQNKNEVSLDAQLYDLVATTPLGEFINSEIFTSHPEECLNLYQSYLNDFINSVYITTRDDEIKVKMSLPLLYTCYCTLCLAGLPST